MKTVVGAIAQQNYQIFDPVTATIRGQETLWSTPPAEWYRLIPVQIGAENALSLHTPADSSGLMTIRAHALTPIKDEGQLELTYSDSHPLMVIDDDETATGVLRASLDFIEARFHKRVTPHAIQTWLTAPVGTSTGAPLLEPDHPKADDAGRFLHKHLTHALPTHCAHLKRALDKRGLEGFYAKLGDLLERSQADLPQSAQIPDIKESLIQLTDAESLIDRWRGAFKDGLHIRWLTLLVEVIWLGQIKAEWERCEALPKSTHHAIMSAFRKTTQIDTTTGDLLAHGSQAIGRVERSSLILTRYSLNDIIRAPHGNTCVDIIEWLQGLRRFHSLNRTNRVIEFNGGWSRVQEELSGFLGEKVNRDKLRKSAYLLDALRLYTGKDETAGIIAVDYTGGRGRKRDKSRVTITLRDLMFYDQESHERLCPRLTVPRGVNKQVSLHTFTRLGLSQMFVDYSAEYLDNPEEGIYLNPERIDELSHHAGAQKRSIKTALERFTSEGHYMIKQGDFLKLGPANQAQEEFILDGALRSREGKERAKKKRKSSKK